MSNDDEAFLRKVQKRQEAEAAQEHLDRIDAKYGGDYGAVVVDGTIVARTSHKSI